VVPAVVVGEPFAWLNHHSVQGGECREKRGRLRFRFGLSDYCVDRASRGRRRGGEVTRRNGEEPVARFLFPTFAKRQFPGQRNGKGGKGSVVGERKGGTTARQASFSPILKAVQTAERKKERRKKTLIKKKKGVETFPQFVLKLPPPLLFLPGYSM